MANRIMGITVRIGGDTTSDDGINNRAVKTLITKIAEEWIMINSRGFEENATFQRIQLFCFFYFRNSGCKGINTVM